MTTQDQNIFLARYEKINKYLLNHKIDAFYISGSDFTLSEYVPLHDNLRYLLTGFKGSTGETLLIPNKGIFLFVDGRYHLQADQDCADQPYVQVVKISSQASLWQELLEHLRHEQCDKLLIVGDRTPSYYGRQFDQLATELISLTLKELSDVISYTFPIFPGQIYTVGKELGAYDVEEKLKELNLPLKQAIFLTSGDDIAWLTNTRCFQLEHTSHYQSKALVTSDHIYVFIGEELVAPSEFAFPDVTLKSIQWSELEHELKEFIDQLDLKSLIFDPSAVTCEDLRILELLSEECSLVEKAHPVAMKKARKKNSEIQEIKNCFLKSSKAIARTMEWAKKNSSFSESALAQKILEEYRKEGSVELSFKTISAFNENAAVIHYSSPKDTVLSKPDSVILLDSGAYYASGYATDATRTWVQVPAKASPEFKKYYTYVLKAQIQAESLVFKEGLLGNAVDLMARRVLMDQGWDFAHGLGHGVGLRVHEPGGGRLSAFSRESLSPGIVCSIEPGMYFDSKWGIRLENVVVVEEHPQYPGFLKFSPIVLVPWEEELILTELLTEPEKKYLAWYQEHCRNALGSY
jgi:Xaa-Pro aminopeptidase